MPTSKKRVAVYLSEDEKRKLEKMAKKDRRNLSTFMALLIEKAYEERGSIDYE